MAFEKQDTYNKMASIVAAELKIDKSTIKPESTFMDLGADSLNMMQIILQLEEQFGIEIKDEDAEKLEVFQQAVDYVHNLRSK